MPRRERPAWPLRSEDVDFVALDHLGGGFGPRREDLSPGVGEVVELFGEGIERGDVGVAGEVEAGAIEAGEEREEEVGDGVDAEVGGDEADAERAVGAAGGLVGYGGDVGV